MGSKLPSYDKYGRKIIPELPWMPAAGPEDEPQTSVYVQRAYASVEYPPLIAHKSVTKTVLHKDTYEYYKPSETIGAAYTPSAQHFKIQDMPPRRKKPSPNPLGPDGKLCYPPKKSRYEEEAEERQRAAIEAKKNAKIPGIIPLMDLLSGKYWIRKEAEKLRAQKRKQQRMKKMEVDVGDSMIVESKTLQKMEAALPIHPDEQKEILITQAEAEMNRHVRPEDIQRIEYYTTKGIEDYMLPPYPKKLIKIAKRKVPRRYKLLREYGKIVNSYEPEILGDYDKMMRWNLLKYVLNDPYEWKRLNIQTFPAEYPVMLIRGPVPWHTSCNIGKQVLARHLYTSNKVSLKIRDLWELNYSKMFILPVDRIQEVGKYPLDPSVFENKCETLCAETRNILIKEWLPKCADILLELKPDWEEYIPKRRGDTLTIIERFFDSINFLMSMQVRRLVMRSLRHFLEFMTVFKNGNDFGEVYYDLALINIPVLKIYAKPVLGTNEIYLAPTINEIRILVRKCFMKILEVNKNITRIENIMFPEFTNDTFLLSVSEFEEEVVEIIEKGMSYYEPNIGGPKTYLKMYEYYYYILNGTAEKQLMEFMSQEPPPYLKDCTKKIELYEQLKNEITMLRCSIPLNFLSLECSELNSTMYDVIDNLRSYIVNSFIKQSHDHNRSICDVFDQMSQRASESPETVAELVELQNFIIECRDVTMFNLKEKIRQTGEFVMFLMNHAILMCK